jgi:hypothetical protein
MRRLPPPAPADVLNQAAEEMDNFRAIAVRTVTAAKEPKLYCDRCQRVGAIHWCKD